MPNTKSVGAAFEDPILNGAVIDNSVIGGTTPVAATFTTMTCTTAVVGGNTLSGAELGYVDGVTPGTATASKAVVLDANKAFAFDGAMTTTEGVASGTARKFTTSAFVDVAATDAVTAVASNNSFVAFAQKYTIPANTIKAGTRLKARAVVRVTDGSGTDTLTCELRIGGTTITATTAVNPGAAGDYHFIDVEFVGRAAPGATASCSAFGLWSTNTGGTVVHGGAASAAANYATNGNIDLDVRAKWSSNTAGASCNLEQLSVEIIG